MIFVGILSNCLLFFSFVEQDDKQQDVDKLQTNFDESYNESSEIIHQVSVQDICAVVIESNWFRAKILAICKEANELEVLLIDYGRMKRVKYSDLRMLKFEFINISPLVILCELCVVDQQLLTQRKKETENDRFCFEVNVMNRFNAIMTHRPTTQIFVKNVIYDRCRVYLYFGGLQRDLFRDAYVLSECYAAFLMNGFSGQQGSGWIECPRDADELDVETHGDLMDRKIPVIFKHIESPAKIFVTFQRNVEFFRNMQFRIQRHVSIEFRANNMHRPPPAWDIGRNCLVYTKDPSDIYATYMWYRGQIIQANHQIYSVRLRDIGTVVEATVNDLLPINRHLRRQQDYAIKCHLSGFEYWLESAAEELTAISKMFLLVTMTINGKQNGSLSVTFWGRKETIDTNLETITEWININHLLVVKSIIKITNDFVQRTMKERTLLKALARKSMSELIEYDKVNASDPAIPPNIEVNWLDDIKADNKNYSDDSDDEMGIFELMEPVIYEFFGVLNEVREWLPSTPIKKTYFSATPTHISTKLVIYLQDSYREYLANKIRNIIHRKLVFYGQNEETRLDWAKGQVCFAKSSSDGLFYRGQIVRLDTQQFFCLVSCSLIDFQWFFDIISIFCLCTTFEN